MNFIQPDYITEENVFPGGQTGRGQKYVSWVEQKALVFLSSAQFSLLKSDAK